MPHFILEYTANLENDLNRTVLFKDVHELLISLGLFPTGGIRSRARRVDDYRFANGSRDFGGIHAELKLSATRPPALRQEVAARVFALLQQHCAPAREQRLVALSMEVSLLEPGQVFNDNDLHALFTAALP